MATSRIPQHYFGNGPGNCRSCNLSSLIPQHNSITSCNYDLEPILQNLFWAVSLSLSPNATNKPGFHYITLQPVFYILSSSGYTFSIKIKDKGISGHFYTPYSTLETNKRSQIKTKLTLSLSAQRIFILNWNEIQILWIYWIIKDYLQKADGFLVSFVK